MNWATDVYDGKVDEEILETLSSRVRGSTIKVTKSDRRLERTRYNNEDVNHQLRHSLLRAMHVFV